MCFLIQNWNTSENLILAYFFMYLLFLGTGYNCDILGLVQVIV